jgi:hypothetical protein
MKEEARNADRTARSSLQLPGLGIPYFALSLSVVWKTWHLPE